MSTFIITRPDGSTAEATVQGLLRILANPLTMVELVCRLDSRVGSTYNVELRDGTAAIVRRGGPPPKVDEPPLAPSDPSELPEEPFLTDVKLHIVLPAKIYALGQTRDHVKETITNVISGACGIPRDFQVHLLPDEVEALLRQLEHKDVSPIQDIDVGEPQPYRPHQRQLAYEEAST